ncbi:MAG TPA: isochorismatase family protein, partial [Myxococcota bacterium]|nr:isochorismatase family protein [Myxococcota bacterium]
LAAHLRERGVDEVWVMGLATDYCVKWTALDAREQGFDVVFVEDGSRGVELAPGDCERAIAELKAAGVRVATSEEA